MQLEEWPLDRFIEYANNPRRNDEAVNQTASAINEFGCRVPLVVKSDGTLIDGHLRLKAARKLGLKTVPVLLADDMTPAQIKGFRISVNQVSNLADWDFDLLKIELEGLQEIDFDLDLLGFDDDYISGLLEDVDLSYEDSNKEIDIDEFDDLMELKLKFSSEQYEAVRDKLREFNESPELALLSALGI